MGRHKREMEAEDDEKLPTETAGLSPSAFLSVLLFVSNVIGHSSATVFGFTEDTLGADPGTTVLFQQLSLVINCWL